MSLWENIKSRREQLKLSQEYVAEQLGVSGQAQKAAKYKH